MIPLRIAFLIAPWCFVWLVAIGCSRQDSATVGASFERLQPGEKLDPELAEREASTDGDEGLSSYAALTQSHSDPIALRAALVEFYEEWGEREGEAAVLHALEQNRTLLPRAFAGWARHDADAPARWVISLLDRQEPERVGWLAAGLLRSLPADDHGARSRWVACVAECAGCEDLVAEVATSWGKQQPGLALDWLAGVARGRAPSAAGEEIFREWAEADPAMAGSRLAQMSAGPAKDRAISLLAKAIDRDDPEAARLWAASISDANLRQITSSLLSEAAPDIDDESRGLLSQAE